VKNNKRNIIILVALMLIVWGGIATQIAGGFYEDESIAMPSVINNKNPIIQKDTFKYSLSLDYQDPFKVSKDKRFNPEIKRENQRASNTARKRATTLKSETAATWPQMKYGGTIKSSNNKVVGLLTISGSSYLVKAGHVLNEISVLQFSENDITVKYNNETKTILK
jgi:Tfp pilus assembly protein PilP